MHGQEGRNPGPRLARPRHNHAAAMNSSPLPAPRNAQDLERARELLDALYGMQATVEWLPSDRDWNFSVSSEGHRWILKLANPQERKQSLEFEHGMMARLGSALPGAVPELRPTVFGAELTQVDCPGGKRWARLLRWLPGKVLADQTTSATTWSSLGCFLARVDLAL